MRKILLVFPLLFVTACSSSTVVSRPVLVERTPFTPPIVAPVQQQPLEWVVVTRDNSQQKFSELENRTGSSTMFALSPQGYQNLSLNVAELRRYIEQQNAVIVAMRKYYEEQNSNPNSNNSDKENK